MLYCPCVACKTLDRIDRIRMKCCGLHSCIMHMGPFSNSFPQEGHMLFRVSQIYAKHLLNKQVWLLKLVMTCQHHARLHVRPPAPPPARRQAHQPTLLNFNPHRVAVRRLPLPRRTLSALSMEAPLARSFISTSLYTSGFPYHASFAAWYSGV